MAAYRRVCDSRDLQADCQEPGSAPEPTLGNRVWATFLPTILVVQVERSVGGGCLFERPVINFKQSFLF